MYRNNFIDVGHEPEVDDAKRRCNSLPPRSRDAEEEHMLSRNYVMSLQQRAEQLSVFARQMTQAKSKDSGKDELPVTSCSSNASTADGELLRAFGKTLTGESSDTLSTGSTPMSRAKKETWAEMSELSGEMLSTEDSSQRSPRSITLSPCNGSSGHPDLCQRPCIYFIKGQCQNGMECGYCHLGHAQRPFHLDKAQRDLIRNFEHHEVLALVLPFLRDRAQAIVQEEDPSVRQELQELMGQLTSVLESQLALTPPVKRQLPRRLASAFQKMTFSNILRYLVPADSEAEAALSDLRNSMRLLMRREEDLQRADLASLA